MDMGVFPRAGHMDVSNTVDLSDPAAVAGAVRQILSKRYHGAGLAPLAVLFRDFDRLYSGRYPGYRACDVRYHNAQHVLDVTLAMARMLDGCERAHPGQDLLGPDMVVVGIAAALFHDSGYIRSTHDTQHSNGAAYTRVHVRRGIRFVSRYLPSVGLQDMVGPCTRILRFTGHEVDPTDLPVADAREHLLGKLLGTADLIAQMADAGYARKCRDYLYEEFAAAGLAGESRAGGDTPVPFRSPEHLLQQTPQFMRTAITVRLDGHFNGVHRYAAEHFGGRHFYMDAIQENRRRLEADLARRVPH